MKRAAAAVKSLVAKEPVLFSGTLLAFISAFFVPPSARYLEYIDFKTLVCLFCLMASVKGFEREGVLGALSLSLALRLKTLRALAASLVFSSFFLSMLITNDAALLTLVPLSLTLLTALGEEEWSAFVIVLQTIAANVGSSLTPVGNPQNLYLYSNKSMSAGDFFSTTLPIVAAGGALLFASLFFFSKKELIGKLPGAPLSLRKGRVLVYSLCFLLSIAAVFDLVPWWAALPLVAAAVLPTDAKTLAKVDYSLLVTFVVIFVFVGNLGQLEGVRAFLASVTKEHTLLAAIVTSQATSNVPAALLLSGFTGHARALLAGVNIGGMGTLIASMASVISYKLYASVHRGRTARYMKLFTFWNAVFLAVLTLLGLLLYR